MKYTLILLLSFVMLLLASCSKDDDIQLDNMIKFNSFLPFYPTLNAAKQAAVTCKDCIQSPFNSVLPFEAVSDAKILSYEWSLYDCEEDVLVQQLPNYVLTNSCSSEGNTLTFDGRDLGLNLDCEKQYYIEITINGKTSYSQYFCAFSFASAMSDFNVTCPNSCENAQITPSAFPDMAIFSNNVSGNTVNIEISLDLIEQIIVFNGWSVISTADFEFLLNGVNQGYDPTSPTSGEQQFELSQIQNNEVLIRGLYSFSAECDEVVRTYNLFSEFNPNDLGIDLTTQTNGNPVTDLVEESTIIILEANVDSSFIISSQWEISGVTVGNDTVLELDLSGVDSPVTVTNTVSTPFESNLVTTKEISWNLSSPPICLNVILTDI